MKTFNPKKGDIDQKWWLVNADGKVLGRLATEVAVLLRGKNKPTFAAHVDTGDFVIVINAEKIKLTGKKREQKTYIRHTGWVGHLKSTTADKLLAGPHADRVVREAVRRMLPTNALGRRMFRKLKVYRGSAHPHTAQQPQEFPLA